MNPTRIVLAIVALIVTLSLGAVTPSSVATLSSRIIAFAFAFSFAFTLVSILAAIPSPADPREGRSRNREDSADDEERRVKEPIDIYANPTATGRIPSEPQEPRQRESWGD